MKSPAMGEALKPLKALEKKAFENYVAELDAYRAAFDDFELRTAAAKKANSRKLEANLEADLTGSALKAPVEPKPKRFIVTDSTYEALGEIIGANPNGVLVHRDEIMSLLKMLDRDENIAARGFFLSGWTGSEGYIFDRIGRNGARIDAVCLSLLGSTQPGRATAYIAPALRGGAADDGMVQRFSLTVWPDVSPDWKYVERSLNVDARTRAFRVFERLANLSHTNFGAAFDAIDDCVYLTFDDPASAIFADWLTGLERLIRSGDLHPALESHFAKYRKLVPTLALINHLTDGGAGPVGPVALNRAIAFSRYLESHARRLYGAGLRQEVVTAQAILSRIRKGELADGFTARDILQNDWAKLTDREQVIAGLALLVDHDWLADRTVQTGGRPRTEYHINPKAKP
jgi:putative DNA primase/helicase